MDPALVILHLFKLIRGNKGQTEQLFSGQKSKDSEHLCYYPSYPALTIIPNFMKQDRAMSFGQLAAGKLPAL